MKSRFNYLSLLRRLAAAASLLAMTAVFFVPAAARWFGWLPRLQLVPAVLAGAVLELVVLAVSVALFGRLYCSVLCPLGIAQDLLRFCFGWIRPHSWVHFREMHQREESTSNSSSRISRKCAHGRSVPFFRGTTSPRQQAGVRIVRYAVLVFFAVAIPLGFTGLLEPYGIFGRFLAVGVRRAGEPATVTVVWAIGLFALVLALTFVRPRFWCNRICPVGTFLGLFSRFALFRVRIDSTACVKCGACAKRCDKGAISVRADKSIAVDHSSCIACGNCLGACAKGALRLISCK